MSAEIANELPDVTILFSDTVGFSERASGMTPDDLVTVFSPVLNEFDHLVEKFGLEKVKTIGDAYMVAAGMPSPRPDYVQAVADMAMEMLEVSTQLRAETCQPIDVRIGMHSGSAVARVFGTKKVTLRYLR